MGSESAPMPDRDQQSGRYVDEYPPEEFTAAIDALGGAGSTQEVAEEVGVIYDTAYKKLRRLRDRGAVTSRKVGGSHLWSLAADADAEQGEEVSA